MLRDLREPQLVRLRRVELASHEIVMDRRARPLSFASRFLLPKRAPQAVVTADAPRGPVAHWFACLSGFVGEEAVPELGIFHVRSMDGIGAICLHNLTIGRWVTEPAIVGLA